MSEVKEGNDSVTVNSKNTADQRRDGGAQSLSHGAAIH